MTLINDLINKKIFTPPAPPRDSWALGTAQGAPTLGLVSVLLDGDSSPVTIATGVTTAASDRVLTCLLGLSRMVVANLTNPVGAVDLSLAFRKAPGNTLSTAAVPAITASGEISVHNNTTGSTNYPTEFGQSWLFTGTTYGRDFILHRTSTGGLYVGTLSATRDSITWTKLWHAGNDGAGSGLDADLLQGMGISASGDRWGVVPYVKTDGELEVGKYLDFHETDGATADYDARIQSVSGELQTGGGQKIWHAGNDGADSGLNADLLDGVHASAKADYTAEGTWTPTYSCNGSMTISDVNTGWARHYHIGELVFIWLRFDCTLGGTASNGVRFSLPHAFTAGDYPVMTGDYYVTNHYTLNVVGISGSSNAMQILRADSTTTFVTGTGRNFEVQGFYKPA